MELSVIFPALNESAVIENTLANAVNHLRKLGVQFEVIVVDNASTDNTVSIVEAFARQNPEVSVVRHPRNLGYANSNLTGFQRATGDVVAVADSDGQHTLADMPLFLSKIRGGADVVYGWRKVRHDPALRKGISACLSVASRLLLGWKLHDINCGFRVVTSQVARSLKKVHPVNYFGPELWVHSVNHGFHVDEVIVHHAERKGGTSIHAPWRLPLTMTRAFRYLLTLRREINSDVPVAAKSVSSRGAS
jgi:glycosyltransferase involved in cell wall biosynthesis